jgi:predicted NAD/FAD-binding protein
MNSFDAAYADVIWGGADGNWAITQTLLSWAVVATVWSADSSIFYTLFGVLGAMSGSYLLLVPEKRPSPRVPAAYAVCSLLAFVSIAVLPWTTTDHALGWALWVLHVSIIAPRVVGLVVPQPEVDRGTLYAALAVASLIVHLSAGASRWPRTDCQISISVDAVVCALITIGFIFDHVGGRHGLVGLWALLLPLASPGFVLAAFCALEQGAWSKLITRVQLQVAMACRVRDGKRPDAATWMNLGYWKEADTYDAACAQLAKLVGDAAGLQKGDRLLSLACGHGDELSFFHDSYELDGTTGLDAQEPSHAAQLALGAKGIRLVQGCASDVLRGRGLFCPEEFNRIVGVDSIYHMNKLELLGDIAKLLPEGGTVAFTDVVVAEGTPLWVRAALACMGIPVDNQWTKREYHDKLAGMGLSAVTYESLEPFVLARWLPSTLCRHVDYVLVSAKQEKYVARPTAAVIGSGLAGLAAARLLASTHQVTVFEARSEPGFAGWEAKLPCGNVVDIPLRMIEFQYWRNLVALCRKLGVPLASTNFTVSLYGGGDRRLIETSMSSQFVNVLKNMRWYLGLLSTALQLMIRAPADSETLGRFAERIGQAKSAFYEIGVRRHFSWILSCDYVMVDNYPLEIVSDFFKVILGNFFRRANPTVRIYPSCRRLQDTLLAGRDIKVNCPAPPFGVSKEIGGQRFDVVVIATEANCVSKVLPREWTTIFDEFQYHPSHIFVHRDPSLMPEQKSEWRSVNVCDGADGKACQISVWVNEYYSSVDLGGDVFETVNPRHSPKPETVIRECRLQRVVHTPASAALQAKIAEVQGREGFYFCGAYAVKGLGLLEQALLSANAAVDAVHRDMTAGDCDAHPGARGAHR